MRHDQTFHETLIPLLVSAIGAESYLEFGTHANETIGKVKCARRYGVDINAADCEGATMFKSTTEEFIAESAVLYAPYDFVFIDADHAFASARADFIGIMPFVTPEGLVAIHDTNPETKADTESGLCADSWIVAFGLWTAGIESLTLPYHPGLTLVRKRLMWGPQA